MRYSFLMSYRDDEKRWKRIQEMLLAEASGKTVRPMVSQRTLFGIPSTVEQTIERIVAEDEEERRARRQRAEGGEGCSAEEPRGDGGEELLG